MALILRPVLSLVSNVPETVIHRNHLPPDLKNAYRAHPTCLHTNLPLRTKIFAEVFDHFLNIFFFN